MRNYLLPRTTTWLGALVLSLFLASSPATSQDAYKIGYITDLSGPLAGSYTPTWEGFELYMLAVNDRGGINGHEVEIALDDDGLKADRAVAHAKKQATRDNVLGIFGLSLSSTQGPVFAEMRKEGVPVVTSFSGILDTLPPAEQYSYSTGVVFEVSGEVVGSLIPNIKPGGGKVVGVTIDTVGGRAANRHNQLAVEARGYQWGDVTFPVRTADFTPHAQAVIDQDPDVVVGHYGSGQNLGMIAALRKAGFNGPYVIAVYGVTEETIRLAAEKAGTGENLFTVNRYASATLDLPAVKEVESAVEKYGASKKFSTMHVTGWVLGKFAEAALSTCGWPCSREKLNSVLETLKIDTNGLSGGPIEMSPDDHYGVSYWQLSKWDPATNTLVPVGDWLPKGPLDFSTE